jgi:DNA-directed RNA polymerase subunit K/omega
MSDIDDLEEIPDDVFEEEFDEYEDTINTDDADEPLEPLESILEYDETEELPHKIIGIDEQDNNHKIIRVVSKSDRVTSEVIQLTEMTEAIGIRCSQIENGAPVLTDVSGYINPIDMAKKEFIDRKNPLIIQRILKQSDKELLVEHWKVRNMIFPITDREIQALTSKEISEILSAQSKKTKE